MTGDVKKPSEVIIVGAGYAGIGAARKLLDEGGDNIKVSYMRSRCSLQLLRYSIFSEGTFD